MTTIRRKSTWVYWAVLLVCGMGVCPGITAQAEEPGGAGEAVDLSEVYAPEVIGPGQSGVILLPDGRLKAFVSEQVSDNTYRNYSITSSDRGKTWSDRTFEYEGPPAFLPLLDQDGEYHVFPRVERREGEGRTIAVDYLIDIWHVKTRNNGAEWEEPQCIFRGYVGSINGVAQLSSGRIVLPFAEWMPDKQEGPPVGANEATVVYSDDGGDTWNESPSRLTAPCYTDYNGSGYGACEPTIIELKDGRVWTLVRTETGYLYESYSDDGVHWGPLTPSRFRSTDAPAGFLRLPDGRMLMFWNHTEKPPRVDGAGVYGGRDALHAAISTDEGKTWRGYREVYRDPFRNEPPPRSGDRGTSYPFPYLGPEGKVLLITEQGEGRRNTIAFDPDWLLETQHADDFSEGLENWSVFKAFGPAKGWWRDRTQGAHLIAHPDNEDAKVLHVRRPDEKPGDGAVWNFPMGRKGELHTRVFLREGFKGAAISLTDVCYDPSDAEGEANAVFSLPIQADGRISLANRLEKGRWHDLRFQWDLDARTCVVSVNGEPTVYLKPSYRQAPGISYLRFRSTADAIDKDGLLVESVAVEVSN